MQDIDLATQTMFAELLQRCLDAEFDEARERLSERARNDLNLVLCSPQGNPKAACLINRPTRKFVGSIE